MIGVAVAQAAPSVKLVSRTSGGEPAEGHADVGQGTAVSGNGRLVAFEVAASNLPGGDGATTQVYVRDVASGTTRLMSVGGGNASQSSMRVAGISGNGRYVGFEGTGIGLPGANSEDQVWVRDRRRDTTKVVSKGNDGVAGDLGSGSASLSASGRYVVFESMASNLPGAAPSERRIYVRDLKRKRTILVSKTNDGTPASGSTYGQAISADGQRITFYSNDEALPGGDGGFDHVYVRDLKRKRTIVADRAPNDEIADTGGYNSSISGNGRFVIFESSAENLPAAAVSDNQVYVRDLKRERTKVAGRNSAGEPQTGYAEFAHLSGSGRYAQFLADGAELPGGDGSTGQVYVRDMRRGTTRLASKGPSGVADEGANDSSISLDGRWVVFESDADNLTGPSSFQGIFRVGPFG